MGLNRHVALLALGLLVACASEGEIDDGTFGGTDGSSGKKKSKKKRGDDGGGESGGESGSTTGDVPIGTTSTGTGLPGTTTTATTTGMGTTGTGEGTSTGIMLSGDCEDLISNPDINWRESTLQTDQEIVECLSGSLGRPVGYGEAAMGGYDPNGSSRLVVITKSAPISVEQQILEAVQSEEHTWVVFDKRDFAEPSAVAMYRLYCSEADVQSALSTDEAGCLDYEQWCVDNGIAQADCLETFFNDRLNDDLSLTNVRIGSNTTIDGRQSEAYFLFNGFKIGSDADGEPVETASSVILTNLRFQGAGHTEDHDRDPDMIRSTGASHDIWIHQNTFDLTGDSAFDVKVGAYNVTMSFNLVKDVKRAALHGSSDSREINAQIRTTMHHNAFITSDELYDEFGETGRRVPLLRRGSSHMFNNVFYNYRKDVMSVRVGATVLFEDNMFLANPAVTADDDPEYYVENLLDDVRDDGNMTVTGSYAWMSDANCNLDPADRGDLTASYGNTATLSDDYSDASQAMIEQQRLPAGEMLADYVLATAGKGGAVPFNSSLTPGAEAIMAMGHRACE